MNNPFEQITTELSEIKKLLKEKIEPEQMLTTKQVCELLHIDRGTVYDWRDAGILKAYGRGKRVWYKLSEVIASLKPINHGRAA